MAESRRRVVVTQADIARAIRAAQAAGLTIARIVVRPDSVAVETVDTPTVDVMPGAMSPRKRIKL